MFFTKLSTFEKIIFFLLASAVLYSFFSIEFNRIYYRDSLWIAAFAYNFALEGSLYDVISREPGLAIGHGRIHDYIYGNFMLFFNNYFYSHRTLSWIISIGVLIIFLLILKNLNFSNLQALLSTLLLSLSEHFLLSSHIARPEILVLLFVFFSLYLITYSKKYNLNFFIAGFLISLSIDIHLSSQISLFMILFYEIANLKKAYSPKDYIYGVFKKYSFFIYGYLLGLFIVAINNFQYLNEIQNAISFATQVSIETSIYDRISWIFTFGLTSKYFRWMIFPTILIIALIIFITNPKKNFDPTFFIFLGGLFGLIILGRMNHHYLLIFFPFLYAYFIANLLNNKNVLSLISIFMLSSYFIFIQFILFSNDAKANPKMFYEKVRSAIEIPSDAIIIAPDNFWFSFKDHEFYSYQARVDLKELASKNKVIFMSNEVFDLYYKKNTLVGKNTGVSNIDKTFLDGFEEILSFEDYHFGSFGLKKNNTITFYQNFK